MIGCRNLRVTAERANFQLGSLYVRAGSAANIALLDVPKRAGVSVTGVSMRVTNCDGTVADYAAVQTDTSWTVDIPASHLATPGTVTRGIAVIATGKGADGETAHSWNIGVGDLCVLDGDSDAPAPGVTWTALRLLDGAPSAPHKGDCYIADGSLCLYDGTTWISAPGAYNSTPAMDGAGSAGSSAAWARGDHVHPSDIRKANVTDLPYALATLTPVSGAWTVSGLPDGVEVVSGPYWMPEENAYALLTSDDCAWYTQETYSGILSLNDFSDQTGSGVTYEPSATRPYVHGATLLDRAANFLAVSTDATLVLPPAVEGKSRDFIVTIANRDSYAHLYDIVPPSGETTLNNQGNFEEEVLGGATEIFRYTEVEPGRFHRQHLTKTYADPSHTHGAADITGGTIDAARLPVATDSSKGAVQVDGTTITVANGVISVVGGGGGGGGVALITIAGTTRHDQKVVVSGRTYRTGSLVEGGVGDYGYVIPVSEDDTVSVDFDGYRGDCSVLKNGVLQAGGVPSELTAGDTWVIRFGDCLLYGTLVSMADGTLKRVEEVSVGDRVASVDPSSGRMSSDSVVGVSRGVGAARDDWTFDGGRTVTTVGRHRFWNVDLGEMLYLEAWNAGERARVFDGTAVKLVSRATSSGKFRHATLWTEKWNNYFANGLLAGNRRTVKGAY